MNCSQSSLDIEKCWKDLQQVAATSGSSWYTCICAYIIRAMVSARGTLPYGFRKVVFFSLGNVIHKRYWSLSLDVVIFSHHSHFIYLLYVALLTQGSTKPLGSRIQDGVRI